MNTTKLALGFAAMLLMLAAAPASAQAQLERMSFQNTPAEQAFVWWARATGHNLVINWDRMEEAGYDRSTPVTMELGGVSSLTALRLLLIEAFDDGVIAEVRPEYVRIITKEQAGRESVIRVYPIGDLLLKVPNFRDAPDFDLSQVTADTSQGSSSSIFEENDNNEEELVTQGERVEEIIDLIRQTVEPDIWQANGGIDGRITYIRGMLVIRAPEYVHRQIGGGQAAQPQPAPAAPQRSAYHSYPQRTAGGYGHYPQRRTYGKSNGVSGIAPSY